MLKSATLLVEAFTSGRHGFVRPNDIQQEILERNKDVKDLVAHER